MTSKYLESLIKLSKNNVSILQQDSLCNHVEQYCAITSCNKCFFNASVFSKNPLTEKVIRILENSNGK